MVETSNQLPDKIGKYQIQGMLGTGAMGTVYRAFDPQIERPVAIKVILSIVSNPYMDEKSCLERFKIEAKAAGSLRHPNIVTVFEVNTEEKPPYLVMDLIDGKGLDDLINLTSKLDPYDVVYYLSQIANAIDHAHQKGIIHRDIKPSNILIDQDDQAFILDFGVASISGKSNFDGNNPDMPVMGSPAYMAPEQILNEELDSRADVFSLAVVAYECLSGHRPFIGDNFTVVAKHILKGERSSILEHLPSFPLQLEAVFEKAFSSVKNHRYKDASTFVLFLSDALGIKNPSLGSSKIRGYKYRAGGDLFSNTFQEVSPDTVELFREQVSGFADIQNTFGKVEPITANNKKFQRLLVAFFILAFGAFLLAVAFGLIDI